MLPLLLAATVTLKIDPRVVARFDPEQAVGATVDAHGRGETAAIFTPPNVDAILSAGFKPLSYRLATELAGEAWHWNPRGRWSDTAHSEGYWTSDDDSPSPIDVSYGFRLPRRGNTRDQAHDDGWSRIDDGDASTFWKSNPYLDARPQWIVVDLGAFRFPDTVRIAWGDPFAGDYDLQYWSGDDPIDNPAEGEWKTWASVRGESGGGVEHRFSRPPFAVRWVRVWMYPRHPERSEGSQDAHSEFLRSAQDDDWRDRAGFAVREIWVEEHGRELLRHTKSHDRQSVVWVSSTDPWHRATDIDSSLEQPGLDLVFDRGVTHGLPMLTPVALLYGTPEDAAAEIRYLKRRRRDVRMIEMGEEPDGQAMSPEDYAALYNRWADAIHAVDPTLLLGGPALQSTRDETGTAWMTRFLADVQKADFGFFSFEWYPFDDVCVPAHAQLVEAPALLARALRRWREEGVPQTIPWLATEYGWSSYAAQAEVDMPAALFNAEFVADFLASGGAASYFYGLEPAELIREKCNAWGNLTLFLGTTPVPAYWGARLVTSEWLAPRGAHELHTVGGTSSLLRAWAVHRPDGSWSMLIINKDDRRATRVRVAGAREARQYSKRDYAWRANGERGRATRNEPPHRFAVRDAIELPPYSMTVVTVATAPPPRRDSDARR